MTSAAKSRKTQPSKSWWQYRRNRNRVWMALAAAGVVGVIAAFFWLRGNNNVTMSSMSVPVGKQVQSVKLEDSRTGEMFDLGQYLGKKDVVIVAYMGEFCLGCSELVGELERRAPEFDAADAYVAGLGYETGQTGRSTATKHGIKSYPLLQEGSPNTFTRSIGMWSDHMDMPWMGYVIVDTSGKIVAGEQTALSEARGAAAKNVDKLLAALSAARNTSANSSYSSQGAPLAVLEGGG